MIKQEVDYTSGLTPMKGRIREPQQSKHCLENWESRFDVRQCLAREERLTLIWLQADIIVTLR